MFGITVRLTNGGILVYSFRFLIKLIKLLDLFKLRIFYISYVVPILMGARAREMITDGMLPTINNFYISLNESLFRGKPP